MLSLSDPHIPIVGHPVKVTGYTVLVAAQCQCSPGATPMQVMSRLEGGQLQVFTSICSRCQAHYRIESMALHEGQLGFGFTMEPMAKA